MQTSGEHAMRAISYLLSAIMTLAPVLAYSQEQPGTSRPTARPESGRFDYPDLPNPIAWLANSGGPLSITKNEVRRLERAGLSSIPGRTDQEKLALLQKYRVQGDKLATAGKALTWMNYIDPLVGMSLRLSRGDTVGAGGHGVNWIGSTLSAMGGVALVGGATVGSPAFLGAILGSIAYDKLMKPIVNSATIEARAYVDLTEMSAILADANQFLLDKDWERADIAARKVIDGYGSLNEADPEFAATSPPRKMHARALEIRGEVARIRREARANSPAPPAEDPGPAPNAVVLGGEGFWKWKSKTAEGNDRSLSVTIDVAKQTFEGTLSGKEVDQEPGGPSTSTFTGTFDGKFIGDAAHGTLEGSGNCRTDRSGFLPGAIDVTVRTGSQPVRVAPPEPYESTHEYAFQLKASLTSGIVTGSAWLISQDGKPVQDVKFHYVGEAKVK
jgi:hypothetical protein